MMAAKITNQLSLLGLLALSAIFSLPVLLIFGLTGNTTVALVMYVITVPCMAGLLHIFSKNIKGFLDFPQELNWLEILTDKDLLKNKVLPYFIFLIGATLASRYSETPRTQHDYGQLALIIALMCIGLGWSISSKIKKH